MNNKNLAAAFMVAALPFSAHADDLAVSGKLGTLGFGVELTKPFSDSITGRVGINGLNYSREWTSSSVKYDFNLELQTLSALADWYPWQGTFRTTAGLVYNNNKAALDAKPNGGSYTIEGRSYTAAEVGSLKGEMTFDKVAPYIGIGWGNPAEKAKTWGFVADIGVLYQNTPSVSLNVTCGTAAPEGTATCTNLKNDVAAQKNKLDSDLNDFKWYPVVSIGLSYKF